MHNDNHNHLGRNEEGRCKNGGTTREQQTLCEIILDYTTVSTRSAMWLVGSPRRRRCRSVRHLGVHLNRRAARQARHLQHIGQPRTLDSRSFSHDVVVGTRRQAQAVEAPIR